MVKSNATESKSITVSEKRQMTIPKRFYEKLGLGNEVICELRGDELVLRPVPKEKDFSEEVLKDLLEEGYSGEELLLEFQNRKAQIRPAVERLIAESGQAARQFSETSTDETEEIFGKVME